MLSPDLQRIQHIRDYCVEIEKTIQRYGNSFETFDQDADYQRSLILYNSSSTLVLEKNGCPTVYGGHIRLPEAVIINSDL